MKFRDSLWLTLASLGTGLLLGIFSILKSPFNAVASLIAVVLALYYFRKNERKGLRIGYVVFSILYYLLFIFMLSVYQFYQLPPSSA